MTSKKEKKIFTGTIPPDDFLVDCSGIFIPNEFLANITLTLEAKIIYLIIKREFDLTNKKFVKNLSNDLLIKNSGLKKRTILRRLNELEDCGLITRININSRTGRDANGMPTRYNGVRYIYLDKRLAGIRKRSINKSKRPVDSLFQLFVIDRKVPLAHYLKWQLAERIKEWEAKEAEEERQHQEEFRSWLDSLTDEGIADYENLMGVSPGTYAKLRSDPSSPDNKLSDLPDDDDGLFS